MPIQCKRFSKIDKRQFARRLRREAGPAEFVLSSRLAECKLGVPISWREWVAWRLPAFYCPRKKLAIVIDRYPGSPYNNAQVSDLEAAGITVLRCNAKRVIRDTGAVLGEIQSALSA
jgi:very-short-patch-repair endonuclease